MNLLMLGASSLIAAQEINSFRVQLQCVQTNNQLITAKMAY